MNSLNPTLNTFQWFSYSAIFKKFLERSAILILKGFVIFENEMIKMHQLEGEVNQSDDHIL